uniref:Uncharacterized protein n=1 Tax=Nelumbo nucifera TaxID=4432 RepID=A0A822ZCJ5_NELNU|nr:TPA_asm: hypothetical protein HUJ06_002184 [Nelumbo nucifera]
MQVIEKSVFFQLKPQLFFLPPLPPPTDQNEQLGRLATDLDIHDKKSKRERKRERILIKKTSGRSVADEIVKGRVKYEFLLLLKFWEQFVLWTFGVNPKISKGVYRV